MTKQASMHIRFASLNLMGTEVSLVSHNSTLNTYSYVILDNNLLHLFSNIYLVKPNSDVLIRL